MNHEELREAIWDLLDGSLDASRQKELRSHLDACAGCAEAYRQVERTRQVLFRAPVQPSRSQTEEFVQRVMGRLPESRTAAWWIWLDAPWAIPALSVGLAAACLSVILSSPDIAPTDTLMLLSQQSRPIAQWILPGSAESGTNPLSFENAQ